jgi:lipoprotein-anchoring transpeptidase ErfK/SrfK
MTDYDHNTVVHRTSIAMLCAAVGATFVMGCAGGEGDRKAQRTPDPPPAISPKRLTPKPKPPSASPAETRPAPDSPAPEQPAPEPPAPDPPAPAAPAPAAPAPAAPEPPPAPQATTPAPAHDLCPPGGVVHAVGDDTVAFAAVARRRLAARRTPNGEAVAHFDTVNANGHAMVFRVRGVVRDGCGMLWYYASLPMRPNEAAAFVPARDVRIHKLRTRIIVELSKRKLVLYRDGEPVLRSAVAVGARSTPTPTGRYYVNQRLIAPDPGGPWGPGALGISAFSDVLQEWIQGGPIGIHGTNDPSSIGHAVSHGCVRLPNNVLMKVFSAAKAGTPVIIKA